MSYDAPHDCRPEQSCARAEAHDLKAEQAHPRWVLAMSILASSLPFIDGSIVNVALPAIRADLAASAAETQWAVNAFTLPLAALLMLGGALGDRYGRRKLLVIGVVLFGLASLLCALVPTLPALIVGRAGQGIGGALLLPNSLALLNGAFSGKARGRAVGAWAAAGAASGALAPLAGGWLVENFGWPSIFWLLIPISVAAATLALWKTQEVRRAGDVPTDYAGAGTATLALAGITLALTFWSASGAFDWRVAASLAFGLVLAVVFFGIESRKGEAAMMPLALFGGTCVVSLNLLTFLLYGALGGMLLILPYLLIESAGYSPTMAGLAIMPFPLLIGLGSPLMGGMAQRTGVRLPLTIGPLVVAGGLLLGLRIGPESSYWASILPSIAAIGIGMAIAVAPLTSAVMAAVEDSYTGTASGLNNAVSRTGGLIAVALMGSVLAMSGEALFDGFHAALYAMAGAAALAGATGWFGLKQLDAKA
ncbi:MFS transporter [Qipengyuania sp.]|uniref:MFS transporter n=1 Tax=Qipengyuania sp. TaxID=2004515 RepID=UPI003BAB734D